MTTACTETNGQCNCDLSTEQQGGLGAILPYTEPTGAYTTSGSTLTAGNATYSYCTEGDTLTLTPQMSGLVGNVALQRDGAAMTPGPNPTTNPTGGGGTATGGGPGSAGQGGTSPSGGTGPASSGGQGPVTTGGAAGAMATGGAGGTMPGAGGRGGGPGTVEPGNDGPCDIYEASGLTCVAAHSTVRALYASYDGNLYEVKRADGTTQDIAVLSPGGFADAAAQDAFCGGSSCTITRIYDQSGHGNFLEAETPDSTVGGHSGMTAANATAEQLTVGGHEVYSLYTRTSQAYWRDGSSSGMPLGAEPQGLYMVTSGTHFNGGCCYDYGNGETSRTYVAGPSMDAIYFGNCTIWGTGNGDGPWIMADMEDGMVSGPNSGQNNQLMSQPFPYVTAMEKNNGTSEYALKAADATKLPLNTYYEGSLPAGKNPMKRQGSIVLGSGGDCCYSNNNASEGTFYEGAVVAGYPSDDTDDAVHANIVEAGYGQ
jgi:hypothetical protein